MALVMTTINVFNNDKCAHELFWIKGCFIDNTLQCALLLVELRFPPPPNPVLGGLLESNMERLLHLNPSVNPSRLSVYMAFCQIRESYET